jgi:hypothetical protein
VGGTSVGPTAAFSGFGRKTENQKNRFSLYKKSSSPSAQARYALTKLQSGLFEGLSKGLGFRP